MPCQCSHETQKAVILDDVPHLQCMGCGALQRMDPEEVQEMEDDEKGFRFLVTLAIVIIAACVAFSVWLCI